VETSSVAADARAVQRVGSSLAFQFPLTASTRSGCGYWRKLLLLSLWKKSHMAFA